MDKERLLFAVVALPLLMAPLVLVDVYDLPKSIALLIVAGVIAATAIRHWDAYPTIRLGAFDLLVLAFLAWLVVSTIFSINPTQSLTGFYKRREGLIVWFAYATVYFAAGRASALRSFTDRLISVLVGFSVPVSLYAILQHFGADPLSFAATDRARSFATTGNPVNLGAYLVLIMPFAVLSLYRAREWHGRLLGVSAFGLGFAALLFSDTRAAWLASVPALTFLVIWLLLRSVRGRRRAVLVIAALALVLAVFSSAGVAERVTSSFSTGSGAVASRLETWRITPRLIMARPLTGWGLETFQSAFTPNRSKRFVELEGPRSSLNRPHNQTLYMGYAAGLPGLVLYLLLIVFSISYAVARFRQADEHSKPLYLAALLSIGGYWLQEQFSFSSVGVTPVAWLVLGVVMAEQKRPRVISLPGTRPAARTVLTLLGALIIALQVTVSTAFLFADHLYRRALASPDPTQAAASLETAVRLNPAENTYRLALAQAYLSSGLTNTYPPYLQKAVSLAEQAAARDPWDVTSHLVKADAIWVGYANGIAWRKADLVRAEKAYLLALSLDHYQATAELQLGLLYRELGRPVASRRALKAALRLDPGLVQAKAALDEMRQPTDEGP